MYNLALDDLIQLGLLIKYHLNYTYLRVTVFFFRDIFLIKSLKRSFSLQGQISIGYHNGEETNLNVELDYSKSFGNYFFTFKALQIGAKRFSKAAYILCTVLWVGYRKEIIVCHEVNHIVPLLFIFLIIQGVFE